MKSEKEKNLLFAAVSFLVFIAWIILVALTMWLGWKIMIVFAVAVFLIGGWLAIDYIKRRRNGSKSKHQQ
jgi:Flp pilus assembly protein protease CpaA